MGILLQSMTETRRQTRSERTETTYTDFGQAITRLQESMDGLSADMSGLSEATAELEASTRALSEKQGEISEQMARTADEIREATKPSPRAGGSRAVGPADD